MNDDKIVTLKLSNGDEIITSMGPQVGEAYTLIDPVKVDVQMTEEGRSLSLIPWVLSPDAPTCLLHSSSVIAMTLPGQKYRNLYAEFIEAMHREHGYDETPATPDLSEQSATKEASFTPPKVTKELLEAARKIAAGKLLFMSGGDKIN